MENRAFRRSLYSISDPIAIGAVVLMLLNDHMFKQLWPSWWTGKLSDFAWVVFMPFLLALPLAWLVPRRVRNHETTVAWLAFGALGVSYGLFNTVEAFHALIVRLMSLTLQQDVAFVRDSTDVISLSALALSWRIWRSQNIQRPFMEARGMVMVVLAALATVATSRVEGDHGISCLVQDWGTVYAVNGFGANADFSFYGFARYTAGRSSVYVSEDGGLTWREGNGSEFVFTRCELPRSRQFYGSRDTGIQYRYVPDDYIEVSTDEEKTWERELDLSRIVPEARKLYIQTKHGTSLEVLPVPLHGIVDDKTSRAIFAMGYAGVLVRLGPGSWEMVSVGPYRHESVSRISLIQVLGYEVWLSILLIPLLAATVPMLGGIARLRWYQMALGVVFLGIGWLAWAQSTVIMQPEIPISPLPSRGVLLLIVDTMMLAVLALPFAVIQLLSLNRRMLRLAVICTAVSMGLFLLPYVLWSQGALAHYSVAKGFALALTGANIIWISILMRSSARVSNPGPPGVASKD